MMFKKNQNVWLYLVGGGIETREAGVVLRVDKRGVWLDNGRGNDPSGPFDPKTGKAAPLMPGWTRRITSRYGESP